MTRSFHSGSWHIETFKINGLQQKGKFASDHFSFTDRNFIAVKNGQDTIIGNWWVESDKGNDDEPNVDLSFSMSFERRHSLNYLSGNWAILERTPTRLRLLSLNADDWEYLTFAKDNVTKN